MAKKLTQEDFIERAKQVHGNKYDYSKIKYINFRTKVCIICPEHGEFWQRPMHHLFNHGCPKCSGKEKLTQENFIEKARKIHGDKYDYSKVNYIGNKTKVCIICPKHGEFWQRPNDHLNGKGCSICAGKIKKTTEQFIEESKKNHGDKYDYSKVDYINGITKVCIICPEHGEFWQTPNDHLDGHGCPKCNKSSLEKEVEMLLGSKHIIFEQQKRFDWLGRQSLDFYLPEYNIAIECQGEQHYKPIKHFGGIKTYNYTIKRDEKKKLLCEKNNIILLYYTHCKINNNDNNIYYNKNSLLNNVLKHTYYADGY